MALGPGTKVLTITTKFDADSTNLDRALATVQIEAKKTGSVLSEAFGRATASLSKLGEFFSGAVGGVDKLAKAMAPWNQAVELAGKVTRFAEEGLSAYAATSTEAAAEVKALTDEFKHYKDAVMQNVGALTVELLRPAVAFEEQRKKLLEIGNTPAFRLLYGGDGKRLGLRGMIEQNLGPGGVERLEGMGLISVSHETNPFALLESAAKSSFGELKTQLDSAADHWDTRGKKLFDDLGKAFDSLGKAGGATSRSFDDIARVTGTDTVGRPIGFSTPIGVAADSTMRDEFGRDAERGILDEINEKHELVFDEMTSREERYAKFLEGQPTLLERLGLDGDFVDELGLAGAAIDGFTLGLKGSFQAIGEGQMGVAKAFKRGLGVMVGGLGDYLAAESGKHFVIAAANAILLNLPEAAKHALAGGVYGLGATAAYATAARLGASVGGSSGVSAGSAGASAGGGRGHDPNASSGSTRDHRTTAASQGEGRTQITVVYTDPFVAGTAGTRRRIARKTLDMARGGDHWESS